MADMDSNIYSSRTALQIIACMWSLPNSDPPIWELHCLRQCLLGSLQLYDQPEDQLALVDGFENDSTATLKNFGSEDVLHFMRLINNMQKTNSAYPTLAEETTEDDFEITFHHFGLPIPSAVEIKECRDMCIQVNPSNLVTKNEAMMGWFAILKRQQLHMGSKETLNRIWKLFNLTRDAAVPFEIFLMGLYYLLRKFKAVNFLLPFGLPEKHHESLKTVFQHLFSKINQVDPTGTRNGTSQSSRGSTTYDERTIIDPKTSTSAPLPKTMLDSRFMKFGEALVDRIADELLQTGLILGAHSNSKRVSKTTQDRNFHMAVREAMKMLLKWDSDDIESEVPTSISSQKAEDYRLGKISGPGKEAFVLHWEKIGCDWNKRAAKIFTDHFISLYWKGVFKSTGDFAEAFIRPENLIKVFMDKLYYLSDKRDTLIIQTKGTAEMKRILGKENSVIAQKNRRRSRKVSMFALRKGALPKFLASNDYEAWTQMLTILGADGMSSDETDEEAGGGKARRVLRIPKPWRSKDLNILLNVLDDASLEPNMFGYKAKGHQRRRIRIGDHPSKTNRELSSLKYPRNFYDADWIQNNKPGVVDVLAENWGVAMRLPSI